jgi:Big-like domain-containing protein
MVNSVNDAPNAQPDAATTVKNGAVSIPVLANDSDVDGDQLSVTSVSSPANGSVSITSSGGGINYRPKPGFAGIDSFSYTVSDGHGGTATATVTVNVVRR